MEEQTRLLERYPTLQYCLFIALGAFGIWVSMPIAFPPQSGVEMVDLIINLIIFVPCSIVAVGGVILATASVAFSLQPDRKGHFATFANAVLTGFGLRKLVQPNLGVLSPFALLAKLFLAEASRESDPEALAESSDSSSGGDPTD